MAAGFVMVLFLLPKRHNYFNAIDEGMPLLDNSAVEGGRPVSVNVVQED
jgi:hypothetical protein